MKKMINNNTSPFCLINDVFKILFSIIHLWLDIFAKIVDHVSYVLTIFAGKVHHTFRHDL